MNLHYSNSLVASLGVAHGLSSLESSGMPVKMLTSGSHLRATEVESECSLLIIIMLQTLLFQWTWNLR